jgi:hypothetical protein
MRAKRRLEARTVQEFADDREQGGVKIGLASTWQVRAADGPQSAPRRVWCLLTT